MELGIDPKVDYAFKFTFGKEENPQPLIHLIHAALSSPPDEQIVSVQILNPFHERIAFDDKLAVLDIKVRDQLGRLLNLEMQMLAAPTTPQRFLYYWASLYGEQLKRGQDWELLKPTISLCFVNQVMFPTAPGHHLTFRLVDPAAGVALTDHLAIHLFELPKFKLSVEELATPLDRWLYFLQHAAELDPERLPAKLDTPDIREAVEELMAFSRTDMQKEIYEGRLRAIRDQRAMVAYAEQIHAKALAEAVEKALAEARPQILAEARPQILAEARPQILAEGRAEGALIGRIELAQKVLRRPSTPRAELEAMPLESLEQLAAQLEQELPG